MDEIPAQYDPRSGRPRKTLAQILDRYTVAPSGCWEWTGTRNPGGYGIVCMMLDGRINTMPAHRVQWMRLKGKPGDGMDICHTCDNRGCINPEHLFEGSPLENQRDMIAKGRDVRVRGEQHGNAKLTDAQVRAIRLDQRRGPAIAADHGISRENVRLIKTRTAWAHVSDDPEAARPAQPDGSDHVR